VGAIFLYNFINVTDINFIILIVLSFTIICEKDAKEECSFYRALGTAGATGSSSGCRISIG
jgi:hypothetical protein